MDNKEPIGEELQNIADIGAKPEPEQDKKEALEENRGAGTIKDKKRRGEALLLKELLCFGLVFLGFIAGQWGAQNNPSLVLLGIAMVIGGLIMAGVFCFMAFPSQRQITEKLLEYARPDAKANVGEGSKEALEKKRVLDLIKDKKRRQKAFLVEELMCLSIVFLGFIAVGSWWPNDLALGMFGGVFIFTGIIMAIVFCGMNLAAMHAHRKAK
jgi:uncharacterized membrane protein (DUF485 family)